MNHKKFTKTLLTMSLFCLVGFNMAEASSGLIVVKVRAIGAFPRKTNMNIPLTSKDKYEAKTNFIRVNHISNNSISAVLQDRDLPEQSVKIKLSGSDSSQGRFYAGSVELPSSVEGSPYNYLLITQSKNPAAGFLGAPLTDGSIYNEVKNGSIDVSSPGNTLEMPTASSPDTITTTGTDADGKKIIVKYTFSPRDNAASTAGATWKVVDNNASNKLLGVGLGADISGTYFINDYFAGELSAGMIFHKYEFPGDNVKKSARNIPITLTAQFHPYEGSRISPYVGAGLAYFNMKAPTGATVVLPTGVAKVAQVGVDVLTDDGFGLNFDVKKYFMKGRNHTGTSSLDNSVTMPFKAMYSPTIVSVGLVFKMN
jgi:outer membrane protein